MLDMGQTPTKAMNGSKITHDEVAAYKQYIEDTEVNTQPLISASLPFEGLKVEFESGDTVFVEKLLSLELIFKRYRRTRGDGNCFFRSFAFRFFEIFCSIDDFDGRFAQMRTYFNNLLSRAGFDKIAYEDFLEESFTLISKHHENMEVLRAAGEDSSEWLASEWRKDPLGSNTMVIVFRMLVSAYLQANADDYIPFIYDAVDPSLESQGTSAIMADYCRRHVEAIGVESDQIDVIAITKILGCTIEIVYLDASRSQDNMVMKFEGEPGGLLSDAECIALLYRPGHYDIIYHE